MILKKRLYKLGGFSSILSFFPPHTTLTFVPLQHLYQFQPILSSYYFPAFPFSHHLHLFQTSSHLHNLSRPHSLIKPSPSTPFFRIPTKMKSIVSISFLLGSLVSTISSTSVGTVTLTALTSHEPENYVDITVPFGVFRPLETRKAFLHGRFL